VNTLSDRIHHIEPQRKAESVLSREAFGDLGHVPEGSPVAAPKLLGLDLTPADYAALEARWIDRGLAEYAQLRRADSLTGAEVIGRKSGNYAGILIPYFHPGSITCASTGCAATSQTWNMIPPAISSLGRST
jgi:hypothetical protein